MSYQAKIDIELKKTDESGNEITNPVQVVLQEIDPFKVTDLLADNMSPKSTVTRPGSFLQDVMGTVIVSPKNLLDQLKDADNTIQATVTLVAKVQNFLANPRIYLLKQKEALQKDSEKEPDVLGESTEQPNTDGNASNE